MFRIYILFLEGSRERLGAASVKNSPPVQKSSRPCENTCLCRNRACSERSFAISRLLIAQNGPKFRKNSIGQLGVRVFTQSARIMHQFGGKRDRLYVGCGQFVLGDGAPPVDSSCQFRKRAAITVARANPKIRESDQWPSKAPRTCHE
jgi:hypothetical protein